MLKTVVGILHNRYLIKGGEDEVSMSETELLQQNGIAVFTLPFVNPAVGYKALLAFLFSIFNIVSFCKTYRWLRKHQIGILHIHNWFYKASPSVLWAARLANVPIVITLHNYRLLCPSGTLSYNGQPYLKSLHSRFPVDAIQKGVYRNSKFQTFWLVLNTWLHTLFQTWDIPKAYIVLTENSRRIFEESKLLFDLNKLYIKPNFISDIGCSPALSKQNGFLYVGRLSQEKGISILLDAFAGLTYPLTIIGNGPLREKVEEYCRRFPHIRYLGFQQKPVIVQELQSASALIFPSIWLETFGLTIIEAFATGTPVIASKQGSAELLVQNEVNGLHFEPENIANLQHVIKRWAHFTATEKAAYSANARKSYEDNYTPENNFHQLISIYEKVLQRK